MFLSSRTFRDRFIRIENPFSLSLYQDILRIRRIFHKEFVYPSLSPESRFESIVRYFSDLWMIVDRRSSEEIFVDTNFIKRIRGWKILWLTFYNLDTIFDICLILSLAPDLLSYRNFVYEYILFDRALINEKIARVALYVCLEGNAERVSLVVAGQGIEDGQFFVKISPILNLLLPNFSWFSTVTITLSRENNRSTQ